MECVLKKNIPEKRSLLKRPLSVKLKLIILESYILYLLNVLITKNTFIRH